MQARYGDRLSKLTLAQLEGSRVRIELSSLKFVMTGTLTDDVIEGEANVPRIKARFRLMRIVKAAPETLARYVGAYRFRNGDYIVIDRFPGTQDTLWVTDVKSGQISRLQQAYVALFRITE